MGFFKKLFKGVKKVFKKIGRGIKKVVGKIGKFMGKIGIVGQIALGFLLPGIGAMLGKAAGAMMGSLNPIISGAGKFLNAAVKIGQKAGSLVKSVGEGITKVVGKTIGATINKIPGGKNFSGFLKDVTGGKLDFVGDTFLGKDGSLLGDGGVLGTAKESVLNIKSATTDLFSKSTVDSSLNKFAVEANIEKPVVESKPEIDTDIKNQMVESETTVADIPETGRPESKSLIADRPVTPTQEMYDQNIGGFRNVVNQDPTAYPTIKTDTTFGTVPTQEMYDQNVGGFKNIVDQDPSSYPMIDAKKSLGTKIYESPLGQKIKEKTTGKLTPANVLRASKATFGPDGQAVDNSYDYTQFDIPEARQQDVGSGGAEQVALMIRPMEIQGYRGTNPQYTPQSSWSQTLAGLTQQTS
tara:strand:- start:1671 stop:2900 length:1230 start_codon:yes stop_codon:yes gene_type:complete